MKTLVDKQLSLKASDKEGQEIYYESSYPEDVTFEIRVNFQNQKGRFNITATAGSTEGAHGESISIIQNSNKFQLIASDPEKHISFYSYLNLKSLIDVNVQVIVYQNEGAEFIHM